MSDWKIRIARHPSINLQPGKQTHWRNVSKAKKDNWPVGCKGFIVSS